MPGLASEPVSSFELYPDCSAPLAPRLPTSSSPAPGRLRVRCRSPPTFPRHGSHSLTPASCFRSPFPRTRPWLLSSPFHSLHTPSAPGPVFLAQAHLQNPNPSYRTAYPSISAGLGDTHSTLITFTADSEKRNTQNRNAHFHGLSPSGACKPHRVTTESVATAGSSEWVHAAHNRKPRLRPACFQLL